MRTTAHKATSRETARREDVAPVQSRADHPGLHRWRPGLAPELQRPVRPSEVVMTPQELHVPAERLFASGMATAIDGASTLSLAES